MNLNEAYQLFNTRHPNLQIGICKFCETRPKECISVGVCTLNQNVKLLLASFPLTDGNLTYHDLLEQLVCSTDSSACMLHRCVNCPGTASLEEFLESKINGEMDHINYKQWVSTDRTTLTDHIATPREFIETLTEKQTN